MPGFPDSPFSKKRRHPRGGGWHVPPGSPSGPLGPRGHGGHWISSTRNIPSRPGLPCSPGSPSSAGSPSGPGTPRAPRGHWTTVQSDVIPRCVCCPLLTTYFGSVSSTVSVVLPDPRVVVPPLEEGLSLVPQGVVNIVVRIHPNGLERVSYLFLGRYLDLVGLLSVHLPESLDILRH